MRFELNGPLSKLHQSVQERPNGRPPGEQYETPSQQIRKRQGDIPSLNCKQDVIMRRIGGRPYYSIGNKSGCLPAAAPVNEHRLHCCVCTCVS